MDKSEDLELEENSKFESKNPRENENFEDLLTELGGFGKYQKRLLCLLTPFLFMTIPLLQHHQTFVLHSPKHKCLPGEKLPSHREMNLTKEEWDRISLKTDDWWGTETSTCKFKGFTKEQLVEIKKIVQKNQAPDDRMEGVYNVQAEAVDLACSEWEYDKSELRTESLVAENNWVCKKASLVQQLYFLGNVGLLLGVFFFSFVADIFGRKLCFYLALLSTLLFTLLQIPASSNFTLFALCKVLGQLGWIPLFDTAFNLMCELCPNRSRELIIGIACAAWSIGEMIMPLLGWYFPSWRLVKIASVIPLSVFFVSWRLVPESPRWLVCKFRTKEAAKIMSRIATTNGAAVPDDLEARLERIAQAQDQERVAAKRKGRMTSFGFLSLFSSLTLFLRTAMMAIGLSASSFVFHQIHLNISELANDKYLNMLILALIDLPGKLFGPILAIAVGRRWSHSGLHVFNTVLLFIVMLLVPPGYSPPKISVRVLCMIVKTNIAASMSIAYIQAVEIFPTEVRMSGIGLCHIVSQTLIMTAVAEVIGTGFIDAMFPFMVSMFVCLFGAIATSFLPETLRAKLPDTVKDSNHFVRFDKYFSFKPLRQ